MKPPKPIDMAPATNSAKPANMTILVVPSDAKPAVRANGTVMPSDIPIIASEIIRGLSLNFRRISLIFFPHVGGSAGLWDSKSTATSVVWKLLRFFSGGSGSDEPPSGRATSVEVSVPSQLISLPLLLGVSTDGAGTSNDLVSNSSTDRQVDGTTDFDLCHDYWCSHQGGILAFAGLAGTTYFSTMLSTCLFQAKYAIKRYSFVAEWISTTRYEIKQQQKGGASGSMEARNPEGFKSIWWKSNSFLLLTNQSTSNNKQLFSAHPFLFVAFYSASAVRPLGSACASKP